MIHRLMRHIQVYLLICFLLISGSGFSINRMECLMSGDTYYSLTAFDCCTDSDEKTKLERQCCNYDYLAMDLEVESLIPSEKEALTLLSIPSMAVTAFQSFKAIQADFTIFYDLPQPFRLQRLLSILQVYRL